MMKVGPALLVLTLLLAGCKEPTPEQVEFQKKFDREAVLVKTCGWDPTVASGAPLKVYRFEQDLWFSDRGAWRRVDGKVDNVCDLLDIDAAHRPPAAEISMQPVAPWSLFLNIFRKPDKQSAPKEVLPGKASG